MSVPRGLHARLVVFLFYSMQFNPSGEVALISFYATPTAPAQKTNKRRVIPAKHTRTTSAHISHETELREPSLGSPVHECTSCVVRSYRIR